MSLKDSAELARRCSEDLGQMILPDEVRDYLSFGVFPERLSEDDRRDMQATLYKELLTP
jgi:hypothetical protein